MPLQVPKPLSPQAHRRFDTLAAPGLLAAAALMARRDPPAAALMAMVAAGEGTAMLFTDYPPPVLSRWLSFRQHIAVANLHAGFIAALALFTPGVQWRHRPMLLGLASVPLLLNALSRTAGDEQEQTGVRSSA
jgi:hypothetical protein